ncbi:Short-chain dehydrogenase/reductase SDR [Penicillium riverlandense]|uniref:Short-chain dehydrogenase/reductase SDR n=1 Tax=Penicillium riverlandense TaxID=1903569 RepID=UPI0025482F29|nr:Short-chain dehydrogenase/reductase SDR [Penicillium riverlandense]KAJ5832448.1 Short-chain dehydrogenase/reductase SDR [Penicillium riverlandense]
METVLVVGATGNIGVSAVMAALRSKRNVLAIVRNQTSADKLVKYIGSSKGITFAEANVLSDTGVKGVVDQVRAGKLPAFQHVFSSVGGEYTTTPLTEITTAQLRNNFNISFEANFFAYRDTIGYLLEQKNPASTWTICTGAQGDWATRPVPAMTQGALFPMATAAARENESTNVRFNELYLAFRVEVDELAVQHGVTKASDFSNVYELILANPEVRSSRVRVDDVEDIKKLKYQKKF